MQLAMAYAALFNRDKVLTQERAILLAGMRGAPNLDPAYIARFEAIFPALAKKHNVPLYPFFLDGVAGQQGMIQPDGMHPTFPGVKRIAAGIAPAVKQALGRR